MNSENRITQSQKTMIFVLTMSLYGLATLFTELIPSFQVGIVEFSVEYFLFIPLTLSILFDLYVYLLVRRPENWSSVRLCWDSSVVWENWRNLLQ